MILRTCHWCHVMERESFEDEEVARILNEQFVAVKVDREERPDIDHVYMTVCQALTGSGGWPLTVIMTPEKKPFFAGTYFPKENRFGRPGLVEVLQKVGWAWKNERDKLLQAGDEIVQLLTSHSEQGTPGLLSREAVEKCYEQLRNSFDPIYGGFGHAPKFPVPHNLTFLLRYYYTHRKEEALKIAEKTLWQMYCGGIFDHIGYGFSRYSTDRKWLVPHFEKMLYDNALLAIAYLEAYQLTKKKGYREVAEKIFSYVERDMTSPEGGFYSAEDADAEGEEGKFYVWTPKEVKEILGEEKGSFFCNLYDITERGNFERKSIPNLVGCAWEELSKEEMVLAEECRRALFLAREKRIRPYKDDKILTSWNALMIAALAIGARVLRDDRYEKAADRALEFIYKKLFSREGRLMARYRDDEAAYQAYLDDYAFLTWALIEMYETTYEPAYLKRAVTLNQRMLDLFWDKENGGLYMTGENTEELPARPKEGYDGAVPSGNSVAAYNFLRLAALTGDSSLAEKAEAVFNAFGGDAKTYPQGYCFLMQAFLYREWPSREIVVVSETGNGEAKEMLAILQDKFLPHTVSLYLSPDKDAIIELVPDLGNYSAMGKGSAAFICRQQTCQEPLYDKEAFRQALD